MRNTKEVAVTANNRDKGKRFFIQEMPAAQFAEWVQKATFAISKNGGNVPSDLLSDGLPGLLVFGLSAITSCSFEAAKPLVDELMTCVQTMPDTQNPGFVRPGPTLPEDFEEYTTILLLQREALELHLGFSIAGAWLEFQASLAAKQSILSNTSTLMLQ